MCPSRQKKVVSFLGSSYPFECVALYMYDVFDEAEPLSRCSVTVLARDETHAYMVGDEHVFYPMLAGTFAPGSPDDGDVVLWETLRGQIPAGATMLNWYVREVPDVAAARAAGAATANLTPAFDLGDHD